MKNFWSVIFGLMLALPAWAAGDFQEGNKPRKKRDLLLPGDPLPPRPCTQGQLTLTNI